MYTVRITIIFITIYNTLYIYIHLTELEIVLESIEKQLIVLLLIAKFIKYDSMDCAC